MKFFTGCAAIAALLLAVSGAQAQVVATGAGSAAYVTVSDFDGPYGPPEAAPPSPRRYGYEPGPGPVWLPPAEIYALLRDNGFSPLGAPRLRGSVYTIAVIDRRGDDGRLVIDARDGRILRFMPAADAFGMAPVYEEPVAVPYGPHSALPPPTAVRGGPPRPPALIPHVASRGAPLPRSIPPRAQSSAAPAPAPQQAPQQVQAPQPAQQTAAVQSRPAETAPPAKPAPTILPTQEMPPAQGLD